MERSQNKEQGKKITLVATPGISQAKPRVYQMDRDLGNEWRESWMPGTGPSWDDDVINLEVFTARECVVQ